ncbi:MAG: Na/Pi cotransporter family protein [Anaerolineae bacterium]|nr:Na/Pi cotransporter family protein [Anaerolineae bacterium]
MLGFVQILGGLALFIYGISLLSSGMEKLAGDQIQKWLDRVTNSRVKSMAFGAAASAILQSSGLLMVTMIGLVNANLMTVVQSIGVMLGQEIGTTVTAQIVAFEIGNFRLILVILGIVFLEFFPGRDWKKYGEILMGLGIIFVGMTYMAGALAELVEIPWVANLLITMGQYPWIGMVAGILATSLTQSSTAVTSMVVAMGMTQSIALEGAIGIILGANIGSCITGLIAALRLSPVARQVSYSQIMINVFGVLLFLPFIPQFADFIERTSPDLPRQIANAHTIFNISVSLILFPFVRQIAGIAMKLAPDDPDKEKQKVTMYIDEMQYAVPAVALKEASRELSRLGDVTAEMVELSCHALLEKDIPAAERVLYLESGIVDPVTRDLEHFVNVLMRADLAIAQQKRAFQIKNLLVDIERVGDMAEDIARFAQDRVTADIPFTDEAINELTELSGIAHSIYSQSLQAFRDQDRDLAMKVCKRENDFDNMYWNIRETHIRRLKSGACHPEANVIFIETLRLLERISDHADNLGISVIRNQNHLPATTA